MSGLSTTDQPHSRRSALRLLKKAWLDPAPQTLATWISDLSDQETGPHADNFVSNEDSYPRIANLIAASVPKDGVYLGVGPDQNFTMIAHAQPSLALIGDHRRRNSRLHLLHHALFLLSDDRVAYLERLTARRPKNLHSISSRDPSRANLSPQELVESFLQTSFDRPFFQQTLDQVRQILKPLGVLADPEWADLETIYSKLAGPGLNARFLALKMYPTVGQLIQTTDHAQKHAHFLCQNSTYQTVRNLQRQGAIVPFTADYAAPQTNDKTKGLLQIAQRLRQLNRAVSLVYISDVEFFLIRSGKFTDYLKNLQNLPWMPNAQIARSSTREIRSPDRVAPDSSTTSLTPAQEFLDRAARGEIKTVDDLFPGSN